MGQIEVFEFLKSQRQSGVDSFFSCRGGEGALRWKGFRSGVIKGVRGDLVRLEWSAYLEAKIEEKAWVRCWRVRSKYARKV